MKRRGFTLIELLVVISIIGLLSTIILASVVQARARARDAKRIQDLQQLQKALELYYAGSQGKYPALVGQQGGTRISCWDSRQRTTCQNFDTNRLPALTPLLNPRPKDPSIPNPLLDRVVGYIYKVNPELTEYKIFVVGTVETTLPPENFKHDDSNDNFDNSLAIYSSNISRDWDVNTQF